MVKQIFVNLPVKDLEKTRKFWQNLGFSFNAQFSDEKAASLILRENIYAMLIAEPFYQTFISGGALLIKKEIADSSKVSEVITAIGVESREKVDEIAEKAFESGAVKYKETDDYGWMYNRGFQDLDGHLWEVVYISESEIPTDPASSEKVNE